RPTRQDPLGTRTETKNVNSFRSIDRAVRFEISRQAGVLDAGQEVVQETRHFHEDTGGTSWSPQVRCGGLSLLPRAGPGPRRTQPRVGRAAARLPAGAARRPSSPAAGGVGLQRPGDA